MTVELIKQIVDILYKGDKTPEEDRKCTIEMTETMMEIFHQSVKNDMKDMAMIVEDFDPNTEVAINYVFSGIQTSKGQININHNPDNNKFSVTKN